MATQLPGNPAIETLSDDRTVVRNRDDAFWVYGTPWPGDAGIGMNAGAPLAAVCFVAHAEKDRVTRLSEVEAAERLVPVASIPWYDEAILPDVLSTLDDLVRAVPAYELAFAPTPDVADFVIRFARSL